MIMNESWNTMKASKSTDAGAGYFSFVYNLGFESDPRELKISRSLVSLSNKVETLKERVTKLDRKIKENYN